MIALSSSNAFAGDYISDPVPRVTDAAVYERGVRTVTRHAETFAVKLRGSKDFFGRPSFLIALLNKTDAPVDFGPENLTLEFPGEKSPTVVYRHEDLERQANNRAGWQRFGAALAASSAGSNSYFGTVHGSGGYASFSGTSSNGYAEYRANREMQADVSANLNNRMNATSSALQTTTVAPGEGHSGMIVFSKPKVKLPATMKLSVKIGEAVETFDVRVQD